MEININRIKEDIENISKFNSTPEEGCTRFSFTPEDRLARDYLINEMKKIGLQITVDAIGNIRGRLEGRNPKGPSVLTGSHIDTVPHGGNFDGVLGVVAGLEILRTIVEKEIKHDNPIELIIFIEEEGCNFGTPMAGSKALTGMISWQELKQLVNSSGVSIYDAAKRFGLQPDKLQDFLLNPSEIKAMLELHVEQSVVLENSKTSVGIVERIAGVRRLEVIFEGVSNHAGATPMNLRQDPLAAASKIIAAIDGIVERKAYNTTVATVGKIDCYPNVINVIPEKILFTVDIRDVNSKGMDIVELEIRAMVDEVTKTYSVKSELRITGEAPAIQLSPHIVSIIEESAKSKKIQSLKMNSGATHDACILSRITDVGMIFVPSIGGRSHVPEESTKYEDIKDGVEILLEAILKLANE